MTAVTVQATLVSDGCRDSAHFVVLPIMLIETGKGQMKQTGKEQMKQSGKEQIKEGR